MAKLSDVIKELNKNREATDNVADGVRELTQSLRDQWSLEALEQSAQRLMAVENQRELVAAISGGRAGPGGPPVPPVLPQNEAGGLAGMIKSFTSGLASINLKFLAPALNSLTLAFSWITAPLLRLGSLVMRGGPVGLAIVGLYTVFKDIGKNPLFGETLLHIKDVWNTKIIPLFTNLSTAVDALAYSELGNFLGEFFENAKVQIQDFVLRDITIITNMFADLLLGITQIFEGDLVSGIINIIGGLGAGILGTVDNVVTGILGLMGIDFGEDGTLLGSIAATISKLSAYISDRFAAAGTYISEKWDSFVGILTVDFPAKIEEWKIAAKDKISGMTEVVGGFIQTIIDGFVNSKDLVVSVFNAGIAKVVGDFKIAFTSLATFVSNIPDQLYLLISKNLRFALPEITIPIPKWLGGGDFTLLSGFDVGVGDATTQAAAQGRIDARNGIRDVEIQRLNDEIGVKIKEMVGAWSKLQESNRSTVVVQDNSARVSNQTNNGAVMRIDSSLPPGDVSWMMRQGRLPNYFAQ